MPPPPDSFPGVISFESIRRPEARPISLASGIRADIVAPVFMPVEKLNLRGTSNRLVFCGLRLNSVLQCLHEDRIIVKSLFSETL